MHSDDPNSTHRTIDKGPPRRRGLGHLILALSTAAVSGLAFWLMWNMAGVPLLATPPLTYWQALGALLLTGLLLRIGLFAVGRRRHHPYRLSHVGGPLAGCGSGMGPRDRYGKDMLKFGSERPDMFRDDI